MYGFVLLHLLDYCEQIALLHERHDISIRKSLFKIFTWVLFIRWMWDIADDWKVSFYLHIKRENCKNMHQMNFEGFNNFYKNFEVFYNKFHKNLQITLLFR